VLLLTIAPTCFGLGSWPSSGVLMCAVKLTYKTGWNAVALTTVQYQSAQRHALQDHNLAESSCEGNTTTHTHCVGNCRVLVHIVTTGLEMWNSRLSIGLPFTDLRLSATSSAGLQERRSELVCRLKDRPQREQGRPANCTLRVTGLAVHGQCLCRDNRREQRCSSTHS
jgi:hypothetical protein